jgi:GNAT acetyltransferase
VRPKAEILRLKSEQFMRLQLELECTGFESGNILAPFPCADPDLPPRVLIVRQDEGYTLCIRNDVPPVLRKRLRMLSPERAFDDGGLVQTILSETLPSQTVWSGSTYVFPTTLSDANYPDVVRLDVQRHSMLLETHQPGWGAGKGAAYGILADGRLAATCTSARENERAAEAWVLTEEIHRRRGYARQVVAAWAHDLQRRGKVPFYSHLEANIASRALASRLSLVWMFSAVGYD